MRQSEIRESITYNLEQAMSTLYLVDEHLQDAISLMFELQRTPNAQIDRLAEMAESVVRMANDLENKYVYPQ